jgi:hypothetical protein
MKLYPSWIPTIRRTALALAVTATIAAAFYEEEDIRGERALRRFEQECRDEGRPLDYAFYKPAAVPDDQNLFKAPIILQSLDARNSSNPFQADTRYLEFQKVIGQWQRGEASQPSLAYSILKKTPDGDKPDAGKAALLILESLKGIKPQLDALDDAALQRPLSKIEFRVDGNFEHIFGTLRGFTQALTLRAVAEVEIGDGDAAFKDIYGVLRLTQGAESFPSFIHLLMANVMVRLALQPYWEGCTKGLWTDSQLRTIEDLLSGFHPIRELTVGLDAARAAGSLTYKSGWRQPYWMPHGWWDINIVELYAPKNGAWYYASLDPETEQLDVQAFDRASVRFEALRHSHSPFTWLARNEAVSHMMPLYVACAHNTFALGCTASALERYRLKMGRFPERLSELVPGFIASVPHDVIDGKPLRYSSTDGLHFKLYSVGLNGVDDQGALPGAPEDPSVSSAPWYSRKGDWVWPQAPVN